MRRDVELALMNGLMDIVKTNNALAHDAASGLLSFLHDNEDFAFARVAGTHLGALALNTSGTLRVTIEQALCEASNSEKGAIRVCG